jgi:hypothetical protein
MIEPFYVSRVEVKKIEGARRRGRLPAGVTIELGVHGPVKSLYRLDAEPDLPLAVDYVVAAAGG